jgi:hypothetical protein
MCLGIAELSFVIIEKENKVEKSNLTYEPSAVEIEGTSVDPKNIKLSTMAAKLVVYSGLDW